MKKLLAFALAIFSVSVFASGPASVEKPYADGRWDLRGENVFTREQKGICGIKVVQADAHLHGNVRGVEVDIRDFADNYVFNNKTETTKIRINYDLTGIADEVERTDLQAAIKVDGVPGITYLDPGQKTFTIDMPTNVVRLQVGLAAIDGTLLDQGEQTVTLTYRVICNQ